MSRTVLLSLVVVMTSCGPLVDTVDGGPSPADGGTNRLELNDVSWLVPLPFQAESRAVLRASTGGRGGPLLPRSLFDALPVLVAGEANASLYAQLVMVGARIDPCFPRTAQGGCERQFRLVLQPVTSAGALGTTTTDTTVHLFYVLDEATFAAAVNEVHALKALAGTKTSSRPLEVHPVMREEGLEGPYAKALNALVLHACGAETLRRVAVMSLVQADVAWRFAAFDVENGALREDSIPRLSVKQQGVQEFGTVEFRAGDLQPPPPDDELIVLLSESELRLTDEQTFASAVTSALRLEHPERTTPKTADCASCHVASRALRNALQERPLSLSHHPDAFDAPYVLTRTDAVGDDPRAMRAFGYFGRLSALSQRTINESAVVAAALSAH